MIQRTTKHRPETIGTLVLLLLALGLRLFGVPAHLAHGEHTGTGSQAPEIVMSSGLHGHGSHHHAHGHSPDEPQDEPAPHSAADHAGDAVALLGVSDSPVFVPLNPVQVRGCVVFHGPGRFTRVSSNELRPPRPPPAGIPLTRGPPALS